MLSFKYIVILLVASPMISYAECFGPKNSKTVVVYLHGMDSESPSQQELENRKVLSKISESLKIGIAIPRAKSKCPNKTQLCWGWNFNEASVVDSALQLAIESQKLCFTKVTNIGLLGFSNGGFVVNQIVKDCKKTDFNWLISIGAGGSFNKNDQTDFSKCSSLTLMAGKEDKFNYESIKDLAKWMKDHKANITLVEYDSGHSLPEKDLETVLKSVVAKKW